MSRLYLVTGFLGAGKTTFLKRFLRLFAGQKIQLIVNEFGKEGVDGALLADLGARCLLPLLGTTPPVGALTAFVGAPFFLGMLKGGEVRGG